MVKNNNNYKNKNNNHYSSNSLVFGRWPQTKMGAIVKSPYGYVVTTMFYITKHFIL